MTDPVFKQETILAPDVMAGRDHIYTQYIALAGLLEWPTNPKLHAIEEINASMNRFGYTQPMLVDERTGRLVAGHGRRENLMAMKERGDEPPLRILDHDGEWYVPVVRGVSFPSDEAAAAYLLADNRLTEKGGWSDENLASFLEELVESGGGEALDGTGFDEGDLEELVSEIAAKAKQADDGSLLELAEITINPPQHQVEKGQVWYLGELHILVCMEVMDEWQFWAQHLRPGGLLVPYPGPYVPFSSKLEGRPALMIQPDPYIAGHILDRYAEVYGEDQLDLLQSEGPADV